MITPTSATVIMICFLLIFGIFLPVLEIIPRVKKCVSLRWATVVALLAIMIGALLDFSHLSETFRISVAIGVMIICGIFIIIRSYEKISANGWNLGVDRVKVEKGEIKAEIDLNKRNEHGST